MTNDEVVDGTFTTSCSSTVGQAAAMNSVLIRSLRSLRSRGNELRVKRRLCNASILFGLGHDMQLSSRPVIERIQRIVSKQRL